MVDRIEWAKFVNELLDEIPRRNKAELSRRIGYRERTIDRWLQCLVAVDEASIRQVADRTGRNALELLIRIGLYRREELPAPAIPPEDQWIVDTIEKSAVNIDPAVKARLIAVELERARREREERKRQIAEQIELMGPDE